jgi:transposase-like protein
VARGDALRGAAYPERRKVERPGYEQLLADLGTMSMVAVGRKYGVSDNAVRKWLRAYERERSTPEGEEAA